MGHKNFKAAIAANEITVRGVPEVLISRENDEVIATYDARTELFAP